MRLRHLRSSLLLAAVVLLAAAPASAQTTLVSTLADDWNERVYFDGDSLAGAFTNDASARSLHSVDVSLVFEEEAQLTQLTATLWTANGEGKIGTPLLTLAGGSELGGGIYRFSNPAAFQLDASKTYWLMLTDNVGSGVIKWNSRDYGWTGPGSIPGDICKAFGPDTDIASFGYAPMPAVFGAFQMRVNGNGDTPTDAVPEPGALMLFLPALGVVALVRRRR